MPERTGVTIEVFNANVVASNVRTKVKKEKLGKALEQGALMVEATAKKEHPWKVRTGRLRNSITSWDVSGEGGLDIAWKVGSVGSSVEYALYLELGTSRMKPYPYLRPALDKNKGNIQKLIRDALKD